MPMAEIGALINAVLELLLWLVIIRILLSWLPNINWYNPPFSWLAGIVDPLLAPFRGLLPPMGGIDFSPILLFISLNVLQAVVSMVFGGAQPASPF